MGKNSPSCVLKTVFKDISDIQSVIKDSKKVEKCYDEVNFNNDQEVEKLIEDTKVIVNSLKVKVTKIDDYFHDNYKTWKNNMPVTNGIDSSCNINSVVNENCLEEDVRAEEEPIKENPEKDSESVLASSTDKATEMKKNKKQVAINNQDTNDRDSEEHRSDTEKEASKKNKEDKTPEKPEIEGNGEIEINEKDLQKESTTERDAVNTIPPASTEEKEDAETPTNTEATKVDTVDATNESETAIENENPTEPKIFIKCVDIKKLINPDIIPQLKTPTRGRGKDSLNDSVCIISDSEDDTANTSKQITKGNIRKSERSKKIKLDKSLKNKESLDQNYTNLGKRRSTNTKSQKNDVVDISDSDSKGSNYLEKRKLRPHKKSKAESSSDTNSKSTKHDQNKMQRKRNRSKKNLRDESLSDTSSFSESEITAKTQKYENSKKRSVKAHGTIRKLILASTSDKKFLCKTYVPLPHIPCEKLKEYYLKQRETAKVKRLTNLNSLKRSRADRLKEKKGHNLSSDTENVTPKSKRKKPSSKSSQSSDSSTSDEEAVRENSEKPEPEVAPTTSKKDSENAEIDEQTAKMLLDNINSGSDASAHESETDEEHPKKKKSTKGSNDKKFKKTKDEKSENKDTNSEAETSDDEKKKEKSAWRKDKLLTSKISDSDSEDEFIKFKKRSEKTKQVAKSRICRKKLKNVIDSDPDSENEKRNKNKDSSGDEFQPQKSSSSGSDSDKKSSEKEEEEEKNTEKKKRRRIKKVNDSSSEDDKTTRKTIRKVIANESLTEATKRAEKEEKERKARIADRQKKYNEIFDSNQLKNATVDKVVLDFNEETKEEILALHKDLAKKLKPHQAKGVQFMWDACYESVDRTKKTNGSGCILAHCMGLGKTLQVIALIHTLIMNERLTGVEKVLVVCPLNTVLNWVSEFSKWLDDIDGPEIEIFELVSNKQNSVRKYQVQQWTKDGGVLILGYDMFRNLTNPTNKRLKRSEREVFHTGLVNPGPDLVVCDEGHLLKNEKSNLSIAMNRIHTVRRIVLTGTPMQNNLKEYYCMVQFVKPSLLGTYKEYLNRFVNPITNGQYTDSTQHDINIMRKRSHVLHKMLDGVVQRRDYAVLTPYLPPKYEYVLFLTLTEVQIKLYRHYLEEQSRRPVDTKIRTTFLFMDFQEFQRICTHPRVLFLKSQENAKKSLLNDEDSEGSLRDFIDDDDDASEDESSSSSNSDSSTSARSSKSKEDKKKGRRTPGQRVTRNSAATLGIDVEEETKEAEMSNEWWSQFCSGDELDNVALSSKIFLLLEILQQCELIGDKLLVFSQSLYSLNIIEYFLGKIDEATQKGDNVGGFSGSWAVGLDYFRLDGSSSCDNRSAWCKSFNSPNNPRARLFLISTKAGGLGINLIGANRVIIFDVSWNPSHDIQSIYRVYRFGQTKPCYIYRFVTNGTMEMKIYERQVTKQAISKRVIDEQQIDRHYNQTDLAELYNFDPKPDDQPTPLIPKDILLAELLQKEKDRIFTYHEHQSLLENKEEEELNEAERKAAWEEYENEKTARVNVTNTGGWIKNLPINSITRALVNIVQKDNPTWSREQVQGVVPLIVQQLREQVDTGEMLLFNRVVNELRLMQASQEQRLQEYYMQQQLRMLQQRFAQQRNAGPSTGFDYESALRANLTNQNAPTISNEIVELND